MSIIVRIGFIIALALFLVRPAFADQYSPIEARYPSMPNFYPSTPQVDPRRAHPPSERNRYPDRYDNNGHLDDADVHQSVRVSGDITIDQTVIINRPRIDAPVIIQATPQPDAMSEPPPATIENNMYIQGLYVKRHTQAPADEYFGRANLSVLGIRNLLHDINAAAQHCDEHAAGDMSHKLVFVEGAYRDWQAKYPDDTWLDRFGYSLLDTYTLLGNDLADDHSDARVHAVDLASLLEALYPHSAFAH